MLRNTGQLEWPCRGCGVATLSMDASRSDHDLMGTIECLVCGCVGLGFGLNKRWPRILPCVAAGNGGRGFAMGVLVGHLSKDWFLGQ